MGLTVHYRFAFRGRKTELLRKLEGLRARFLDLPVRSVEEVVDISHASSGPGYALGAYVTRKYEDLFRGRLDPQFGVGLSVGF